MMVGDKFKLKNGPFEGHIYEIIVIPSEIDGDKYQLENITLHKGRWSVSVKVNNKNNITSNEFRLMTGGEPKRFIPINRKEKRLTKFDVDISPIRIEIVEK